jgi:hypothetical protein
MKADSCGIDSLRPLNGLARTRELDASAASPGIKGSENKPLIKVESVRRRSVPVVQKSALLCVANYIDFAAP